MPSDEGFKELDRLAEQIIGAAIEVHKQLGPGLLESAYEQCLAYELEQRGFHVERQKMLPIIYKGLRVDRGYRIDLLVEDQIVLELKTVDAISAVHEAQLLSYLKFARKPLGFILNFNTRRMIDGIKRRVMRSNLS